MKRHPCLNIASSSWKFLLCIGHRAEPGRAASRHKGDECICCDSTSIITISFAPLSKTSLSLPSSELHNFRKMNGTGTGTASTHTHTPQHRDAEHDVKQNKKKQRSNVRKNKNKLFQVNRERVIIFYILFTFRD